MLLYCSVAGLWKDIGCGISQSNSSMDRSSDTSTLKYRGLSTTAAKNAAPDRDDSFAVVLKTRKPLLATGNRRKKGLSL
jgi:hypothetical protein